MSYATAVGIYIVFYLLGSVLPLLSGDPANVFLLVAFSIPILLVMPRVGQRFTDGQQLSPELFRRSGGFWYGGGIVFVWIGHLVFFGTIVAGVFFASLGAGGLPIGIFTGYAVYPYLVGIILVEIAYRQWANRHSAEQWKRQQNSVYVVVGLIIATQLTFNLTSDRPVDLLSYDEREAVALGRGYAREVQRVVTRVYVEEERMPCASDNFLDPNTFLHSANRDLRKMLSIELLECGQFVVTIHEPVDGVADGQLLYVASPGDADAGRPLEWQCLSAHHERIERHTNGGCTYDGSLANTLPASAETSAIASRATRTLAPPSVAPVPRQPPGLEAVSALGSRAASQPPKTRPSLQAHLDRIAEPTLWHDCGSETTTYRMLRFDANQYVAAVRISHDSREGAFRSVTSSSPDKSIGLDGWVSDRTWERAVASFESSDFWNLQSAQAADGTQLFVEACKNGTYHAVEIRFDDPRFAHANQIFGTIGKLNWLEN